MIDLHTHSTASDGTMSPSELVHYARERALEAISLTDHDTVEGVEEALAAGNKEGIEVVPGIEISAEHPGGTLHIAGYFIDINDPDFLRNIAVLQKARAERNPRIVHKLQQLGLDITYDEIKEEAETGQVGRPHFAQVMLKKGYIKKPQEAFDKYLKKGAPAYEDKFRFPPDEAIAHIVNAGGIAVLNHPVTLNCRNTRELESFLETLLPYGLGGVEAYYSDHNPQQAEMYRKIAEKHGLLVTGGSDFHGKNIKGIDLGTGRGNLNIPYSVLESIKKALAA